LIEAFPLGLQEEVGPLLRLDTIKYPSRRFTVLFGTLHPGAGGWEAARGQLENNLWEEHMDEFVWIRVVTPDWEYTERLAQ
jgi:hypothetical protein